MRVIFVPVANRPECAKALRAAFELGQHLDAHMYGCHIRPHRHSEVSLPDKLDPFASDDAAWELAMKGKRSRQDSIAAKALFANVAKQYDLQLIRRPRVKPGAIWTEKVGSPDKVLSIMGPISDLLVVSRPAKRGGKVAALFMLAALMDSSRPTLIMPHRGVPVVGRRISIAWNQSAEAAKAVSAALPLLQRAEQVHILTAGTETGLGPKSSQLATYLRFWGINTQRIVTRGRNEVKELLEGYRETRSDMLVMGAYSRGRWRQQIFGGLTDYMLKKADIPVFMLHS